VLSIGTTTQAQGFYFSKPVEAAQALLLLRDGFIRPAQPALKADPKAPAP